MLNVCRSIISYIKQFLCQIQSLEQMASVGATEIEVPSHRLFTIGDRVAVYSETGPCEIRTIVGKRDWTTIQLDEPLTAEYPAGAYVQKLIGPTDQEIYIKGVHLGPLKTPPPLPAIVLNPNLETTPEALTLGALQQQYHLTAEAWIEVSNSAAQNEMILQIGHNLKAALRLIIHPLVDPLRTTTLVDPTEEDHTAILVADGDQILVDWIYVQSANVFRQYRIMGKECYPDGTAKLSLGSQVGYRFEAGAAVLCSMRHFYRFDLGDLTYSREPWGGSDCAVARLDLSLSEEMYRPASIQYPAQWAQRS